MNLGLKDRVALITGASRGLGRATAEALAREGARFVALARNAGDLAELEAAYPGQCVTMAADMLEPDVPQRAVARTRDAFGRLDIVIANTPGPRSIMPLAATDADFATAFDTVFYPAVRLIRAAVPLLLVQERGRIVIVSSTSVRAPKAFLSLSASARSALWSWAKSAAPELYEQGITINAVFAGPHNTDRARELGAIGRPMGRPDHFGAVVATMCAEATQFITGTGYLLDGGELRGL